MATLAVLCALPLVQQIIPFNIYWLPVIWAACAFPVGALLTLSFWVGLGNSPLLSRLVLGVVGAVYTAFWVSLIQVLEAPRHESANFWLTQLAQFILLVVVFGGLFMILRKWWRLALVAEPDVQSPSKSQFSVLHLLLLTAAAAVVMAMVRASRASDNAMLVATVLGFSIFFFNTAAAAFAALGQSPPRTNCVLALAVAALLGVAISLASGQDRAAWWLVAGGSLISVIPTGVVITSLLVVRSIGYRLVRKVTDHEASRHAAEISPMA